MDRRPWKLTPFGNVVVVTAFLMVLGIVGWIEGL